MLAPLVPTKNLIKLKFCTILRSGVTREWIYGANICPRMEGYDPNATYIFQFRSSQVGCMHDDSVAVGYLGYDHHKAPLPCSCMIITQLAG